MEENLVKIIKKVLRSDSLWGIPIEDAVIDYENMPFTLPIGIDPALRRICQTMTHYGYVTNDTCEGHGKKLPKIYFRSRSQPLLRHFGYMLCYREGIGHDLNVEWHIQVAEAFDPTINPSPSVQYLLGPRDIFWDKEEKIQVTDPSRDHDKLLQDLDVIGVSLVCYFKQLDKEKKRRR